MGFGDWFEDRMEDLEDAGDAVLEKVEQAGEWVQETAEKLATDAVEDVGNVLTDPAGASLSFLFERPLEIFGDTAILPWDQAIADTAQDWYEQVAGVGQEGLETYQDLHRRAREMFEQYVGNPLRMADQMLQEEFPEYASVRDDLGVVGEMAEFLVAVARLVAELPGDATHYLAMVVGAIRCKVANELFGLDRQGKLLEAIANGDTSMTDAIKIKQLPAAGRYFITSDLHLYTEGDLDAATLQDTPRVYRAMLRHYAGNGFSLVENGDIEDFWLEGGSLYGHAFGLSNGYGTPLDSAVNADVILQAAEYHLREVHDYHAETFAEVQQSFHSPGRYSRTFGNHDDVFREGYMVDALRTYHPGIDVYEYLVFSDGAECVGIACHGHQTDTWNSSACGFMGKRVTTVWSLLRDIPFIEFKKGLQTGESTRAMLNEGSNEMSEVNAVFGLNSELGSLDEVNLFHACQEVWGPGHATANQSLTKGPYVLLGHTHTPHVGPQHPEHRAAWRRYYNSGCAIFHKTVTGIEWDGTQDALNPVLTMVAWRNEGGTLRRYVMQPVQAAPWKLSSVSDGVNYPM